MGKRKKGGFGGPDMLSRLQRVQEELAKAQAELAEETVEASAGGGAVKVVMSGSLECKKVEIAPHLLEEGDVEMLEDLIQLAVTLAIQDAQYIANQKLGPLAGGLTGGGLGG